MSPKGKFMASELYWDFLVDRSYLGANDLLTEDPPLPNWPFEEYVHIPIQPDMRPYEDDAATARSVLDCEDDRSGTYPEPIVSSSELDRTILTAAKDVELDVVSLEDDGPTTTKTVALCLIVLENDEPAIEKSARGSHSTMLPPDKPCAKKASESDRQPDKPRVTLPTLPEPTVIARLKKQRGPKSTSINSISPNIDAQSTTQIKTSVKKKQPAKKMSIPGLGEFTLAVKVEPGQEQESTSSENKTEGKEDGLEPKVSPTPKRSLLLTSKALSYISAATEAYNTIYHFEEHRQQKSLVCYIHAHPTSLRKSETQCINEAENLRQEILLGKERNLRAANPSLPFKPASSFPDSRFDLQNTMGMIIAMQNKPRLGASAQEKKIYDACLMHEMLKWEVEMMTDVTKWCDSQRIERLKETGIKFRVRDGLYIDLETMISFPINETT